MMSHCWTLRAFSNFRNILTSPIFEKRKIAPDIFTLTQTESTGSIKKKSLEFHLQVAFPSYNLSKSKWQM